MVFLILLNQYQGSVRKLVRVIDMDELVMFAFCFQDCKELVDVRRIDSCISLSIIKHYCLQIFMYVCCIMCAFEFIQNVYVYIAGILQKLYIKCLCVCIFINIIPLASIVIDFNCFVVVKLCKTSKTSEINKLSEHNICLVRSKINCKS